MEGSVQQDVDKKDSRLGTWYAIALYNVHMHINLWYIDHLIQFLDKGLLCVWSVQMSHEILVPEHCAVYWL